MCICFYTLQDPRYALVLATNRDEFLQRPATAAHFWPTKNDDSLVGPILAGKDLTGGGTWCGINTKTGNFGLLTNVREEVTGKTLRSRGKLVSDWLADEDGTIHSHIDDLSRSMMDYAGYNLLLGRVPSPNLSASHSVDTAVQMGFLSNRSQAVEVHGPETTEPATSHDHSTECVRNLEDAHGHGVLSNGALVCGSSMTSVNYAWPKMDIGRQAFATVLKRHNTDYRSTQATDGDNEATTSSKNRLIHALLDSVLS